MTRVIMLGVGGSTDSTAAMRWTIDRAAALGAIVRMVHVAPARDGVKPGDRHRIPEEDGSQRTEDTVNLLTGTPHDGEDREAVIVQHEVVNGRPGPMLAGLSREADLLVIGSPQQKPEQTSREQPGSTTRYIMRHAKSPVAVIKHSHVRTESSYVRAEPSGGAVRCNKVAEARSHHPANGHVASPFPGGRARHPGSGARQPA